MKEKKNSNYFCISCCLAFSLELLGTYVCAGVCFHYFLAFSTAVQVRVQAIRGLPLFCKDTPENIGKMVDILVQILGSGKLWYLKLLHC